MRRDARPDSAGEAHAEWWLGPKAGVQRAQVLVGSGRTVPPATVIAAAFPGEPVRLTAVTPTTPVEGTVGVAVARPLVVRVTDAVGNPVPGVAVSATGPGVPADFLVATDSLGLASVRWTLGEQAGAGDVLLAVAPTNMAGRPAVADSPEGEKLVEYPVHRIDHNRVPVATVR